MLQNIRERLQGWIAAAVLLIIGVPLAITFGKMDAGTTADNFAARVNGESIPASDFQRVYQNQLLAQQAALRSQLPPELEDQLKHSVLDSLVLSRVVTQYVTKQGYRVSDDRVAEFIRGAPAFKVGGEFSKPAYEATLAAQGLNPINFEREQRALMTVRQLQEGLAESAFFTPAEFRRLIALEGERRDVEYLLLDPKQIGATIVVSDTDVQGYYAENTAQFKTPESVTLDYIEIAVADLGRDYVPDEAALRQAFDADPGRFRTAEERRARHVLIAVDADRNEAAAKALADDVAQQLGAGGDFAKLAAKYSNDTGSAPNGGELGWAGRGVYVAPFETALFGLKTGETSPVVRTEFGYHIIQLEEIRAGAGRSFDDVRAQLTDELRRQHSQDGFLALADRLDDLALENQTSLEPVAKQTGLAVRRLTGFTRSGGGPFGSNQKLVTAVFGDPVLGGGENTPLIELEEGRAVVARVAEHKLPEPKPIEQVHGEIVERLRTLRAVTAARNRGEEILKRAQAGEDLGAVATALGQTLTSAGGMTRRSPGVQPDLAVAVFRAPRPVNGKPVIQGAALDSGGYLVFRISGVSPGEPDALPREQRDQRKRFLAQQTAIAETEGLAAELKENAEVMVSPSLFKKAEDL